jgi:hypothetical protein
MCEVMRGALLGLSLTLVGCGHAEEPPHRWAVAGGAFSECEPRECGRAPDDEALLCRATGMPTGPTGRCLRDEAGRCAWEIATCDTGSILTEGAPGDPDDDDRPRDAKPR